MNHFTKFYSDRIINARRYHIRPIKKIKYTSHIVIIVDICNEVFIVQKVNVRRKLLYRVDHRSYVNAVNVNDHLQILALRGDRILSIINLAASLFLAALWLMDATNVISSVVDC